MKFLYKCEEEINGCWVKKDANTVIDKTKIRCLYCQKKGVLQLGRPARYYFKHIFKEDSKNCKSREGITYLLEE